MERTVELSIRMSHGGPPPSYSRAQREIGPPEYSTIFGPPPRQKKHCTRRRRWVALACIIIVAAIILGATGKLLKNIGKKAKSNTEAAKSTKAISNIAAAECGEGNLFIFYQDMTSSLYMHMFLKDMRNWTAAEKLNDIPGFVDVQGTAKVIMTINDESPLSAICWINGTDIELRLYYLDKSLFPNEITGKVSANSSTSHTLISHRITPIFANCSKSLTATYLPALGIKLYCLNTHQEIYELSYSNSSTGWTQTTNPVIDQTGVNSMRPPMAITVQGNGTSNDTQIHLFYHVYYGWPKEENGITTTVWDAVTGSWSNASVIEHLLKEEMLYVQPKPLAACLTSFPFSIHVFYTENFAAHELVFSGGAWSYERTIDAIEATDELNSGTYTSVGGPVASLAWKGLSEWQIRLFYAYDAKVRMATFENGSWTGGVKIDGIL